MNIVENYQKALDAVYEHVGFKEDWVVCPLDDQTSCYWYVNADFVRYSETIEKFFSDGDYEGADFTMIFCDPHTDGVQWFRLFDNKKRIRTLDKEVYLRKDKLKEINKYDTRA